jgi:ParB-like nuclease domain
MSEVRRLPLSIIKIDLAIQQRAKGTSPKIVQGYADDIHDGDEFPPVVVFSADQLTYYLADGFHRIEAYCLANPDAQEIDCEVHRGGRDDAVLFARGANASHGLRRSIADKKKAVLLLLMSEKWGQWSDHEIARQCNVSHPFVGKVRARLEMLPDEGRGSGDPTAGTPSEGSAIDAPASAAGRRRKVKRKGVSYCMKTAAIGSGSTRSSPRKSADSAPPLMSFSWSEASMAGRIKFVRDVGGHQILDVLKIIDPGFSILNWAWKNSQPEKRQSFAVEYDEVVTALAKPIRSELAAQTTEVPTHAPGEMQSDGDGLDIPTFLQRGHPDCPVKTGSAE